MQVALPRMEVNKIGEHVIWGAGLAHLSHASIALRGYTTGNVYNESILVITADSVNVGDVDVPTGAAL